MKPRHDPVGPVVVLERDPMGFRVFALAGPGDPMASIIVMDDEQEARDCAAIMAGCAGWPIDDRTGDGD